MPERKLATAMFLAALALAAACLLPQKLPARAQSPAGQGLQKAGAPLKGVEVKLARYAGAQVGPGEMTVFARATTDGEGKFKLPVVPAGKYVLILELPEAARKSSGPRDIGGLQGQLNGLDSRAYVTLSLPGDKKVEKGYDFAKRQAFDPLALDLNGDAAARAKVGLADFIFESDGASPCEGIINTSRSNVKGQ